MKTKFASIAQRLSKYPCGLLVSSDGLLNFRFNVVRYSDDTITFSKANSFDSLSFNWDSIKSLDVDPENQNTIRIETSDKHEYFIIDIQQKPIFHNRKAKIVEYEDVCEMALKCLSATLLYQDQGIFSRTEFPSVDVDYDSNEITFGGHNLRNVEDDETIIELSDGINFTKLILSMESEYVLSEQTSDYAIIRIRQDEQPFANIMLIMRFTKYEVLIPADKLFAEETEVGLDDEK